MGGNWTQFFPPNPDFTEENLPSLAGKVFIVTGGNAGVGLEVVKLLYTKGGTVYIASRNPSKIAAELESTKAISTSTPGQVKSLPLDLSDLTTIPKCISAFLSQESRLDVLFNNAGISQAPIGSTSKQGYEAHMGTNCLGPYLLTRLLEPILQRTAAMSLPGSVRVVFTSSQIVDMAGPPGGISIAELEPGKASTDKNHNYSASKAGNWFLASEFDKRLRKEGIISVTQNPGMLRTKGWDNAPWLMRTIMSPLLHPAIMGAYTALWVGLSPEVTLKDGGRYAVPWGRWHPDPRRDLVESMKSRSEGGTGLAAEFFAWCEKQTSEYI